MKSFLEKFKNQISDIIKNKVFILVVCLIIADAILGIVSGAMIRQLPEQLEADRWDEEKKMSQVSLFFTEDQLIDSNFIKKMEFTLKGKMTEVGIVEDDDDEDTKSASNSNTPVIIDTQPLGEQPKEPEPQEVDDSRLYASCYSAQGIINITFEKKTAEKITAIGTEGDFFLFHPLELVSGSYYMPDAIMKDQIVIDEDLAWQLFGSNDVAGEMVTIGEVPHYVAGVVKREEGKLRTAAGQSVGIAYISYDSLCKYGVILSGRTENTELSEDGVNANIGGINCYEVVMPGPVDGIVAKIVKESAALDDKYISVVDNTARFSFFALMEVIMSYGTRSMWNQAIYFPYWENLARGYEDLLATILFFRLICRIIVIIIAAIFVIHSYRNKKWTVRGVFNDLMEKKYDFEVARRIKKNSSNGLKDN
jgi:hypothetical protein